MSTTFDRAVFGSRLRKAREDFQYATQKAFAKDVGISVQAVNYYESGQRTPDASTLYLLSEFFGCSVDWLLGVSDVYYPDVAFIEEKTGLNESNIIEMMDGKWFHKDEEPSKHIVFNIFFEYIREVVDAMMDASEEMIGIMDKRPSYWDASILRKERDLQELENAGVSQEIINFRKQFLDMDKEINELRKEIYKLEAGCEICDATIPKHELESMEYDRARAMKFCKFQFLQCMDEFFERTVAALSEDYRKWLLETKQREMKDIEWQVQYDQKKAD